MIARQSSSVGIGTGQIVVPQISTKCHSSVCRSEVLIRQSGKPSKIGDASFGDCIESLRPFVGPSDGKGGSAPVNANTQPGRALPTVSQRSVGPCRGGSRPDPEATGLRGQGALRRLFSRAKALHDVVARCWIGDFIGGLALFSLLIIGLFLGWGAGLQ